MAKWALGGIIVFLGLAAAGTWAAVTAIGWMGNQLPALMDNGRQLAAEAERRGEVLLPELADKAKAVAPDMWAQGQRLLGMAPDTASTADGRGMPVVPPHPALAPVGAGETGGGRSVAFEGEAPLREVAAFYRGALLATGHAETARQSAAGREAYQFERGDRRVSLVVGEIAGSDGKRIRVDVVEF